MTAPFDPPTPSATSKPHVPPWIPPQPTSAKLDWADLHTIELSKLDSPDPAVVADLVETTKIAIKHDGFLFLTDYGVSLEQVSLHQLAWVGEILILFDLMADESDRV